MHEQEKGELSKCLQAVSHRLCESFDWHLPCCRRALCVAPVCAVAWQVASCHSSAIGTLSLLCYDGKPFFQQSLEQQAKQLPAANYVNAGGDIVTKEGGDRERRGGCLSMISFCRWVQHNYISYFGVIGEPLQMLSLAHLFIRLASGGVKGQVLHEC